MCCQKLYSAPCSCWDSVFLCNSLCSPGALSTAHPYLCLLFLWGGLGDIPSAPVLTVWLQGGRVRALEAVTDVISLTSSVSPPPASHCFRPGIGNPHTLNTCHWLCRESNSGRLNVKKGIFLAN